VNAITTDVMKVLPTHTKDALTKLSNELGTRSLDINAEDVKLLLPEQVTALKTSFASSINGAKTMIDMKIQTMDIPKVVAPAPTPVAPTPEVKEVVEVPAPAPPTPVVAETPAPPIPEVHEVIKPTEPVWQDTPEVATGPGIDNFKNSLEDILADALTKVSNLSPYNPKERAVQAAVKKGLSNFSAQISKHFN
jgi:hypothetical protein